MFSFPPWPQLHQDLRAACRLARGSNTFWARGHVCARATANLWMGLWTSFDPRMTCRAHGALSPLDFILGFAASSSTVHLQGLAQLAWLSLGLPCGPHSCWQAMVSGFRCSQCGQRPPGHCGSNVLTVTIEVHSGLACGRTTANL